MALDEGHVRRRIEEERARLAEMRRRLAESVGGGAQGEGIGELSVFDQHPADVASEVFERTQNLALLGYVEKRLRDLAEAAARLESGHYGVCRG